MASKKKNTINKNNKVMNGDSSRCSGDLPFDHRFRKGKGRNGRETFRNKLSEIQVYFASLSGVVRPIGKPGKFRSIRPYIHIICLSKFVNGIGSKLITGCYCSIVNFIETLNRNEYKESSDYRVRFLAPFHKSSNQYCYTCTLITNGSAPPRLTS